MFEIGEQLGTLISNQVENIPTFNKKDLSYNDFFQNYMLHNEICIIQHVTDEWGSNKFWMNGSDINFDYLRKQYGPLNVTVYNCLEKEFNTQRFYDTTFDKYLDYFQALDKNTEGCNRVDYLKNWHLKLNTDDNFYEVPIYFASDWLNEYCVNCLKDDYRFVYMGPKDTWTPFHADVFCSFSWSVNVCGRKKWLLFPPGEELHFKDSLGNLPYDIAKENLTLGKYFEVIQGPGEAIFVPSGWHHQVWNLDNAISINHNWVNGCNIKIMYDSLQSNLESIEEEIEDCKSMENFEEHCQLMLNALFGMDFYKFYDFLKYIALNRISMIEGNSEKILFHGHEIGENHIKFDLKSVRSVLVDFVKNELVQSLNYFSTVDTNPSKLLEKIENILGV